MPYYYPIFPALLLILASAHFAVNTRRVKWPAAGMFAAFCLLGYSLYIIKTTPFPCGNPSTLEGAPYAQMNCVLIKMAMPVIHR